MYKRIRAALLFVGWLVGCQTDFLEGGDRVSCLKEGGEMSINGGGGGYYEGNSIGGREVNVPPFLKILFFV